MYTLPGDALGVIMTAGDRAVQAVSRYCCRFYETWGSNRGPEINRWSGYCGWPRGGLPWCGIGLSGIFREAGLLDEYGGTRFLSPATGQICANGNRLGWRVGPSGIVPGSVWGNCGNHVGMVTMYLGHGLVATIGCNTSGGIYRHQRSIYGYSVYTPPGIKGAASMSVAPKPKPAPPKYRTDYYLRDPKAKPRLHVVKHPKTGKPIPFRTTNKKARDTWLARMQKPGSGYYKYHPRPSQHKIGNKLYYDITLGPIANYGAFDSPRRQAQAKRLIERRLGRRLQPWQQRVKVS